MKRVEFENLVNVREVNPAARRGLKVNAAQRRFQGFSQKAAEDAEQIELEFKRAAQKYPAFSYSMTPAGGGIHFAAMVKDEWPRVHRHGFFVDGRNSGIKEPDNYARTIVVGIHETARQANVVRASVAALKLKGE